MLTRLLPLIALLACESLEPTRTPESELVLVAADPSDDPIAGLNAHWTARFAAGDATFEAVFREPEGLGPLFIRASCAGCHAEDGRGPGVVDRAVGVDMAHGQVLRNRTAAGATTPIEAPEGARIERRLPLAVFGRGYIDAVTDNAIRAQAARQAERGGPIRGIVPMVGDAIGRYGVKSRIASLEDFVADAYVADMGISSSMRPDELANPDGLTDDGKLGADIDQATIEVTADYVRLLAIPPRTLPSGSGEALFETTGCTECHTPSLPTRADYPIPQLRDIAAPIYSDLLLHDMGPELADGIDENLATGQHFRTAPLLGLRHLRAYLHDGRAETVEAAIRAHSGEAESARRAFEALGASDRRALVSFVEAL
ncbi:MAG: di-heme oxidoredictase family protein [Myxococcota bacterium]